MSSKIRICDYCLLESHNFDARKLFHSRLFSVSPHLHGFYLCDRCQNKLTGNDIARLLDCSCIDDCYGRQERIETTLKSDLKSEVGIEALTKEIDRLLDKAGDLMAIRGMQQAMQQ